MDLKSLRYHPLRYDVLRDSSDEVLEAFWDDDLTEEEIAEIGGPDALRIIVEQEELLASALHSFNAAGQHIYHLEPKLVEMFRRTSVDEVPIDLLTISFKTVFIYFGPEAGISDPVNGRIVDGAYVSLSHHDDGSLLFISLCSEFRDLARAGELSQIARIREDQGYHHLALHSSAGTVGEARASLTTSYGERVSEFEHYRHKKIARDVGVSDRRESYEEAKNSRLPEEANLLWKDQDLEATNLIVNALAFLTSRPEDIEYDWRDDLPEKLVRKAREKSDSKQAVRAVSKLEAMGYRKVYTCGKQLAHRVGDENHASPEAHWRRGHWRLQAHGPARSDRKLMWIEPTLVHPSSGVLRGRIHMVSK